MQQINLLQSKHAPGREMDEVSSNKKNRMYFFANILKLNPFSILKKTNLEPGFTADSLGVYL